MKDLLDRHYQAMAIQLVDSPLLTTRAHWRQMWGYPQFALDPRPLAELIERTDPDLTKAGEAK